MNDTQRLIIALVASAVLMLAYGTLFAPKKADQPQPEKAAQSQQTPAPAAAKAPPRPAGAPPAAASAPAAPAAAPAAAKAASAAKKAAKTGTRVMPLGKEVVVENRVAFYHFNELGGGLRKVVLKHYYNQPGKKGGLFKLLDLGASDPVSLGLNLGRIDPYLSRRLFKASAGNFRVSSSRNSLSFVITTAGQKVVKTYTFSPDSYEFKMNVTVTNTTSQAVEFQNEIILVEHPERGKSAGKAFAGVQTLKDRSLEEMDLGDLEDKPAFTGKITWMTMTIPYFMGAVIPLDKPDEKRTVRGFNNNKVITGTLVGPLTKLLPGQFAGSDQLIFYGPRDLEILKPLGHDLDEAVDFGWFDILAKPMLYFLNFLFGIIGNYGVAIIIITILTKVLFWPLAQKSYKSMNAMRRLQPQMKKIREKYKDDKQRQNQEMMQLYKTYKINPMGGCLPMIVQIPVFIAFYKVLGASIELRHAPFMLWINDLSAPDRLMPDLGLPYVGGIPVLTLVMGVSMFLQQKMTPTTGDPTQAKVMMLLPVVFTFMFLNFPAGLVLYWLVNNILSIGQQYFTNKYKA